MTIPTPDLADLGWNNFFLAQLADAERQACRPARIVAVHRSGVDVVGAGFAERGVRWPRGDGEPATVGDWLLMDPQAPVARFLLARRSVFRRRAAGSGHGVQLIAANVDTLLVVTSCNREFSLARLERYLALAADADVTPLVVLTKADLADPQDYVLAARSAQAGLLVETVDARDAAAVAILEPWCGGGQTVACVGSSGVGKTTLINTLTGGAPRATAGIREDDAKGRHTTSGRSMHRLAAGGWVIDTPGMRELGLFDVGEGLDATFADVAALAARCRFADCRHEGEPGCAVGAAVAAGDLDAERLKRYRKLVAEDARNTETLAMRRARDRRFGKMVKTAMSAKRRRREL